MYLKRQRKHDAVCPCSDTAKPDCINSQINHAFASFSKNNYIKYTFLTFLMHYILTLFTYFARGIFWTISVA